MKNWGVFVDNKLVNVVDSEESAIDIKKDYLMLVPAPNAVEVAEFEWSMKRLKP